MAILPEPQSVDEALDWHLAISDSVIAHRAAALLALANGVFMGPARFVGLTAAEIDEFFRQEQSEVDGMCVVNIVAAAEAAIRADYRERVRRNRSDALAQAYVAHQSSLSGAKVHRPDFDKGGILDALKLAHVVPDHLVTAFRRVLRLRHWYAHGRHWLLKTSIKDDPAEVYAVSTNLLVALAAV